MVPPADSQLTRRHTARARTASGQSPQTRHPTGPPGQSVIGRSVIRASTSDGPTLPGSPCTALPESQDTTTAPSLAQNLPILILEKIFDYLPVAAQCRCARVCRHWESCLPSLRQRLTQWLKEEHPVSYQAASGWGQGFHSRTRPLLQASRSPLLPILMQLQQERQERQEHRLAAPRQHTEHLTADSSSDLFPGLVRCSLETWLIRANQLALRPVTLQTPHNTSVEVFNFSACSRWLTLRCRHNSTGHTSLQLYGWENNGWKPCPLTPCPTEPVSRFRFSPMPEEVLVGVYGQQVIAWRREPDTNQWHHTLLHRVPVSFQVLCLWPMPDGDQLILDAPEQQDGESTRRLCCYTWSQGAWKTVTTCHTGLSAWAQSPQSSELAQNLVTAFLPPDHFTSEMRIWRKGLNTSSPEQWGYQTTALPWRDTIVYSQAYSPGGKYLQAILHNGRSYLWSFDAQCCLRELLILPHCLLPWGGIPNYPASFSADEKQLAVPLSTRQIKLCYTDDKGDWQHGQVLEAPRLPADRPDTPPTNILLSANGSILVRVTEDKLDIWHRPAGGHWHHSLQRKNTAGTDYPAQACLLDAGELICTTAADPTLCLWVHGPDSQGRLVRKASMEVQASIGGLSPDGLSLVASSTLTPLCLLQLSVPQDSETNSQTGVLHSGRCRLL